MALPLLGLAEIGFKLIDELWETDEEKKAAQIKLLEAQNAGRLAEIDKAFQLNLAQLRIAEADARSGKGGMRDMAGKVAVFALAYAWLAQPLLTWAMGLAGMPDAAPPEVDTAAAWTMLTGMLGLAGVRSFDLMKGSRQ